MLTVCLVDAEAIAHQLAKLSDMDACWNVWFTQEGVEPLRIYYEDLSIDPISVFSGLLEYLGVEREAANGLEITVTKLADSTNQLGVERFLSEKHRHWNLEGIAQDDCQSGILTRDIVNE